MDGIRLSLAAREGVTQMLTLIAYGAVALGIALLGALAYAATKPDSFTVSRSLDVHAPSERIFPLIANLRTMNTWNPFVAPDPDIRITYSGPDSGAGAVHTWSGNRNVGEGRIEIVEATQPTHVAMRLQMIKPLKADNRVDFSLAGQGDVTRVTWAMTGRQPFIGKLMTLVIDCDRMVGSQFEKGLADLKAAAER